MRKLEQPDFQSIFESVQGLYLILLPDLTIVAVSDAYLIATMTTRREILGKGLFEVFPDNPDDPAATGVSNLRASFNYVLEQKKTHTMAVQKYDIRRPDGSFEERFWSPLNKPVYNEKGGVKYIIHRVEDVTEFIRVKSEQQRINKETDQMRTQITSMEVELYKRAQEIQKINEKLLEEIKIRKKAEAQVQSLNSTLEEKVNLKTREIKENEEKFRSLASHLQDVREEERSIIAREIHDELGQQLTVLKMHLDALKTKIGSHDPILMNKINNMIKLASQTMNSIRKIATQLRPSILDEVGLMAALEWQSHEFEKQTGIKVRFYQDLPELNVPEHVATNIFRIYQETLTNVARHAMASSVESAVTLHASELVLTISDNGRGFNPGEKKINKTLGIIGMKERALMMKGKLELVSHEGLGTTITLTTPLVP